MTLKTASIFALGIALAAILFLIKKDYLFSKNPLSIGIQICAAALMLWSRVTFGARSFHAAANTTQGELVTTGPYRLFRHPIYAAAIYFFWACVISYPYIETIIAAVLVTTGLFIRMILEEKSLNETYPEYAAYSKRTRRIIPFVF